MESLTNESKRKRMSDLPDDMLSVIAKKAKQRDVIYFTFHGGADFPSGVFDAYDVAATKTIPREEILSIAGFARMPLDQAPQKPGCYTTIQVKQSRAQELFVDPAVALGFNYLTNFDREIHDRGHGTFTMIRDN